MAKKVNRVPARAKTKTHPAPSAKTRPTASSSPATNTNNYDDELRGVLFRNSRKTRREQPDMQGSCQIGGVEYWVSGWAHVSKQNQKYLSLAFTPKFEENEQYEDEQDEEVQHDDSDVLF